MFQFLLLALLAKLSNHYFLWLGEFYQILANNRVISKPLWPNMVAGSDHCVTLHRGYEKSCWWIDAPLNRLQPPSVTYLRCRDARSRHVDMVVQTAAKTGTVLPEPQQQNLRRKKLHIQPHKNQRVFATFTVISYYDMPQQCNAVLICSTIIKMAFIFWARIGYAALFSSSTEQTLIGNR